MNSFARTFLILWILFSRDLVAQEQGFSFPALNPSVLSSIDGSIALSKITQVERWQKLLSINPETLRELQSLRSGEEIENAIERLGRPASLSELRKMREKLVKARLAEILDTRQRSLMRVLVLREHYGSPVSLFRRDARLLIELGMTEEQFSMMVDDASLKIREVRAEVIEMVMDSLESIAANLAEDKANRLWDLFGRDFLSPPRSEFQWNQIQCLPSSGPWNQLMGATTVVLGDDLKLSRSQIADLIPLGDKEFVNRLNNRINENEISDQLDQILSKSQRSAIVQELQRGALVSDMKVLLTPEVGKHVGLEKEEEELIVKAVNEATERIRDFRITAEMELLRRSTSIMPKDYQEQLAELTEGVWN